MSFPLPRTSHRGALFGDGVGLVLCVAFPGPAVAQTIALPPGAADGDSALAAGMPEIARRAAAVYRDSEFLLILGNRARFSLAAGEPQEAIDALEALKGLPSAPSSALDPRLPALELMARARILEREGSPRDDAYREAFREVFAPFTDREAYEVGWYLGTPPWVFEQGLETALAAVAGRDEVPVAWALALVRAWVVQAVHGEVFPLLPDLLEAEERRRFLVEDILTETPLTLPSTPTGTDSRTRPASRRPTDTWG